MKFNGAGMSRRLQIPGILLIAALTVEAISLFWSHPTAFLVFLFIGGLLMATGILVYLYSLVTPGEPAVLSDRDLSP